MPGIRIIDTPIEDYINFTNSHEDLKMLAQCKRLIDLAKKNFEEELERAESHYIDPNIQEAYEYAVDTLNSAWEKANKVSEMLRRKYMEKERKNGRTEE